MGGTGADLCRTRCQMYACWEKRLFILTKSCSMYNPTWGSVDVAYLALLAAISGPQRSDLGSQQQRCRFLSFRMN
jgi:hypothetical protein